MIATAETLSLAVRNVIVGVSMLSCGLAFWAGVQNVKQHDEFGYWWAFSLARFGAAGAIGEIAFALVEPSWGSLLVKTWLYIVFLTSFVVGTVGIIVYQLRRDPHSRNERRPA